MLGKPVIRNFPLPSNGYDVYDIVYLGHIIPNCVNSPVSEVLKDEYVFVFTTNNGNVEINFIKHELLSYFNEIVKTKGNFHVLSRENLILNDFIEIIYEETEQGSQIIAHLINQKIRRNYGNIVYTRDFKILLVEENGQSILDNIPLIELGPEFSAKLDLDRAEEHLKYLRMGGNFMKGVCHRNPQYAKSTEMIQHLINEEIKNAKQEREQLFNKYLNLRSELIYV